MDSFDVKDYDFNSDSPGDDSDNNDDEKFAKLHAAVSELDSKQRYASF